MLKMTVTHFRAPQKYPFNLTEQQIRDAFDLWDLKTKQEIMVEIQDEYPMIDFTEDESMLELILNVIGKATTRGMKMSVDHMDVLHYYMEDQKKKDSLKLKLTQYKFQEGMGISGVLLPSGEFTKCGNAEHYIAAEQIDFEEQKKSVYFSSFINGKDGVVTLSPFGNKTMTDQQIMWIDTNLKYLDDNQKFLYDLLKNP
jgi:hypothetical protein